MGFTSHLPVDKEYNMSAYLDKYIDSLDLENNIEVEEEEVTMVNVSYWDGEFEYTARGFDFAEALDCLTDQIIAIETHPSKFSDVSAYERQALLNDDWERRTK